MIDRRPKPTRGLFWMLAGGFALALAFWAEHVAGMAPCELCLWERWPYRVLVGLGLLWALCAGLRPSFGNAAGRLFGTLVSLTLLVSIGIGLLHVGVEQGWWPSPLPECAAPHFVAGSFSERLASMPVRPAKPCDAPNRLFAWLPVSMTTLDVVYAASLLAIGLAGMPARRRRY